MATIDVSIILPVYNAEEWLEECLQSISIQTFNGAIELSVYDDASTDNTKVILDTWIDKLATVLTVVRGGHSSDKPKGVGFAKNEALKQSHGRFFCFLDADDVMMPQRIEMQLEAAISHPRAIIGCQFDRIPSSSTQRYSEWANGLTQKQLKTQVYTSHGPTVIMPTWFCSRDTFNAVGHFDESGKGTPEDLIFFYKHLDLDGDLFRVDLCLLSYRYHPSATTFSVSEETIWELRLRRLEEKVLTKWKEFTVWNAGKQGRKFYRSLKPEFRKKVIAFCDVDVKKITLGVYIFEESKDVPKPRIPIIHFKHAKAPFIICVKLGLTKGQFEENLSSLNLEEGRDYFHFN